MSGAGARWRAEFGQRARHRILESPTSPDSDEPAWLRWREQAAEDARRSQLVDEVEADAPESDDLVAGWRVERLDQRLRSTSRDPRIRDGRRIAGADVMVMTKWSVLSQSLPFRRFDDEGVAAPAECWAARFFTTTERTLGRPHRTPHPQCQCGYRIVTDPGALMTYYRRQVRDMASDRSPSRVPESVGLNVAIVSVAATEEAVCLRPGRHNGHDDPGSTWRVSQYRLTGTVLLPATAAGRAVKHQLRRIRGLDVEYVPSLHRATSEDLATITAAMSGTTTEENR